MGGFAGGDEGGYWDEDTPPNTIDKKSNNKSKNKNKVYIERHDLGYSIKAYAKADMLLSRSIGEEELYDTISFVPCLCETFTIEGCADISLESNTIYKAYKALNDFVLDSDILDFFYEHKVVVIKRIPLSAGLRGSSSDAAAFMYLLKEVCNLILSTDELANIGATIDPDIPFFINTYDIGVDKPNISKKIF